MKVKKFDDFVVEDTYAVNDDGLMVKQDIEIYKDAYPSKFIYHDIKEEKEVELFDSEDVYVLKIKDKRMGVFSGDLSDDMIKKIKDLFK